MRVNKLGHLVTSFFSDSLTDVVAVARGVYGGYLRGGYGGGGGTWERGTVFGMLESVCCLRCSACVRALILINLLNTTGINYTYLSRETLIQTIIFSTYQEVPSQRIL